MAEIELVDQVEALFDPVEADKHRSDRSLETKESAFHNVDLFTDSYLGGFEVSHAALDVRDIGLNLAQNLQNEVFSVGHYSL